MAELVFVTGLSHAPGLTGWLDRAPQKEQQSLTEGFNLLGKKLRAAKPDLIIGLANDHVLNMPVDNQHDFCVGISDSWSGPAEWFQDWVNIGTYQVDGNAQVAGVCWHLRLTFTAPSAKPTGNSTETLRERPLCNSQFLVRFHREWDPSCARKQGASLV